MKPGTPPVQDTRRTAPQKGNPVVDATLPAPAQDDTPLMRRLQRGDTDAFGCLVERYMQRAHRVAVSLVGWDDAMDLSQDAFVRAFRAASTVDPERPFFPWYYQILRRLCLNHLRDHKSRRAKLDGMTPWLVGDATSRDADRSPEAQLRRRDTHRRLREAIDTLSAKEREVFMLREYEEASYAEIAELVGIPVGTVMSRLYAARKKLAARLDQEAV